MTTPALAPDPGIALARVYGGLPDHYRAADAADGDYPLFRFLAGVCGVLSQVEDLVERIDYVPADEGGAPGDTSDLVDPAGADVGWLPWLSQLVGVRLRPDLTDAEKRDAVQFASSGWRAGTKQAVADAARTELTGSKYAGVFDHSVTAPGDGGVWDVLIVTRTSETPDVSAVLAAVARRGAKPAGVVLHHRAYEASWDTVTLTYPSWSAIDATAWNKIQEAGL